MYMWKLRGVRKTQNSRDVNIEGEQQLPGMIPRVKLAARYFNQDREKVKFQQILQERLSQRKTYEGME